MTVAEIALAIMLVAGAGWLVRGFATLRTTNLGFVADQQRLHFRRRFSGPEIPQTPTRCARASHDLIDRLRGVPGRHGRRGRRRIFRCEGTTENSLILQFHGEPLDPAHPMGTRQRFVSPGYFASTGHELLRGPRFRPGRSARPRAGRDRQPDLRQAVPGGTRPDRRAVRGRLSDARSAQRGHHHRRRRRRAGRRPWSTRPSRPFTRRSRRAPVRRQTMVVATSHAGCRPARIGHPRPKCTDSIRRLRSTSSW